MVRRFKPATYIASAAALVAAAIGIFDIVDKRNEVATLRAELANLKVSYETTRAQNERLFQLAVGVVKDGQLPLQVLQPFLLPAELKQVSEKAGVERKEALPLDVDAAYFPSGWMGDGEAGERFVRLGRAPVELDGVTRPAITIQFRRGPKGWAGIYWQYPDSNWGDQPGRNLSDAKTLAFSAKGKSGGEIVEFKAGGIRGKKYADSFEVSLGKQVLEPTWTSYAINLSAHDLASVIGAFAVVAAAADNPSGTTEFSIIGLRIE